MRAREVGLISLWYKKNTPDIGRCLRDNKSSRLAKLELEKGDPLTLAALSGVFVFFSVGCAAPFFIFAAELLTSKFIKAIPEASRHY